MGKQTRLYEDKKLGIVGSAGQDTEVRRGEQELEKSAAEVSEHLAKCK